MSTNVSRKPQRVTHEERRLRRREVAYAIRDGRLTPAGAAQKFKMSITQVRMACLEYGVPFSLRQPATTAA